MNVFEKENLDTAEKDYVYKIIHKLGVYVCMLSPCAFSYVRIHVDDFKWKGWLG